jgi:hypothetical protein
MKLKISKSSGTSGSFFVVIDLFVRTHQKNTANFKFLLQVPSGKLKVYNKTMGSI